MNYSPYVHWSVSRLGTCTQATEFAELIMFRPAGTAEIVRSHQKDDFYLTFSRSSVADVVQSIAGVWFVCLCVCVCVCV